MPTGERVKKTLNKGTRPALTGGTIVASYKLDEGTGTSITDSSGNGHTGTLTGASNSWSTTSMWGDDSDSLVLGADGYVDLGDNNAFSFGDGATDSAFSIEAWVDLTGWDGGSGCIASKYNETTAQREWLLWISSTGRIDFYGYDESTDGYRGRTTSNATNCISTGNRYHIVGTYNGNAATTGWKIYVNGIQVDSANITGGAYTAMENTTSSCFVGAYTAAASAINNLLGKVSQVTIYNTELSAATVLANFTAGLVSSGNLDNGSTWQLISRVTIGSGVAIQDFPVVLDGDLDLGYKVKVLNINDTAGSSSVDLRMNGASIVGDRSYYYQTGVSTVSGAYNAANGVISQYASSAGNGRRGLVVVNIPFSTSVGSPTRFFETETDHAGSGTNLVETFQNYFRLSTPAAGTKITSIGVMTNVATGLGIGTILELYKLSNIS